MEDKGETDEDGKNMKKGKFKQNWLDHRQGPQTDIRHQSSLFLFFPHNVNDLGTGREELVEAEAYLSQEGVVWLVLVGHEHNEDSVKELNPLKCSNTHVKEDTEENRHGDFAKDWCHDYRQTNQYKNYNVSQPILPENKNQKSFHNSLISRN